MRPETVGVEVETTRALAGWRPLEDWTPVSDAPAADDTSSQTNFLLVVPAHTVDRREHLLSVMNSRTRAFGEGVSAEPDPGGWLEVDWDQQVLLLDDDDADTDNLIEVLSRRAGSDEPLVVDTLFAVAEGKYMRLSAEARALALEILSMSGLPRADQLARLIARSYLTSSRNRTLRFAGVAIAGRLTAESRFMLLPHIERLAQAQHEPDAGVRRAAKAFLAVYGRFKGR